MKLLSVDVGIKNLAFCLLNVSATAIPSNSNNNNNNNNALKISECDILQWGVIDVCHSEQDETAAVQRAAAHHKCSHPRYTSKTKSNSSQTTTAAFATCASNAAFFYYKDDLLQFICKRHANKLREYETKNAHGHGHDSAGVGSDNNNNNNNNNNKTKVFHLTTDAIHSVCMGIAHVIVGPLKPAKLLNSGTAEQLFAFCNAHDACEPEWEQAAPRWNGLKPVMRDRARHVMRTRYMHAYDALDEVSAILNPATAPDVINSNTCSKSKPQPKPEHVSLITVGSNLVIKFDKLFYGTGSDNSPDKVIIENQISPIATRMKTVQGMVTQYFLMRGIPPDCISYISATNKLKAWTSINGDADEIDTYDGRKKLGIACVRKLLSGDGDGGGACDDGVGVVVVDKRKKFKMGANTALKWRSVFEAHKKKDDMADSLLQGLSYL